jgi:hypothetical protein
MTSSRQKTHRSDATIDRKRQFLYQLFIGDHPIVTGRQNKIDTLLLK